MVNAVLVVFLVAVAGGALAARPNAVLMISCQNSNTVCWNHVHSDVASAWQDGESRTCAVLDCSKDKATVHLYTPTALPPGRVDHRTLDAAGRPHSGSACNNPLNNQLVTLDAFPVATGGIQTIPDQGIEGPSGNQLQDLNADYADMLAAQQPAFDLNADYAQMWAAMSGRKAADRKGYKFSVSQGECQSGQSEGGSCPNRHPVSQHTFEINEYFPVSGTPVELVTITHLVVSCDLCISSTTGDYLPVVKHLTTAQCQNTTYHCTASISADGKLIDVRVEEDLPPSYHAGDPLVGWQLAQMIYGIDPIITIDRTSIPRPQYHHITGVGQEIDTKIWPLKYHVQTDNVVEEDTAPPRLRVRCEIDYCDKTNSPVIDDDECEKTQTCICKETPRCDPKWQD